MSHHGSQVVVRNSLFDHNGATGVRDVYDDCDSNYEDCVFFENLVAGVDAMGRRHRFLRCLFLDNYGAGLSISKGVTAEVEGCTVKGEGTERSGIRGWQSTLEVKKTVLSTLKVGISVAESRATLQWNAFTLCELNYDWHFQEGWKSALGNLKCDHNQFSEGAFRLSQKEKPMPFADFRTATQLDAASVSVVPTKPVIPPVLSAGGFAQKTRPEENPYGSGLAARLPDKYRDLPPPDARVGRPVEGAAGKQGVPGKVE